MWTQTYLEWLENLLKLDFQFLQPWKDDSGSQKPSKLFRACFVSPLVLVLIMTSFVWFFWNNLLFIMIAENLAIAIGAFRCVGYSFLVKKFFHDYKKKVDEMLNDRKSMSSGPAEQRLTESYNKTEFVSTLAYHLNCYCIVCLFFHAFVVLMPNDYQLLFNCHILFLPPDEFSFNWEINYLVQTITTTFSGLAVASFVPLPFLLMDHSCWLIDMALVTAEDLNEHLKLDDDIRDPEKIAKTNESLKKFGDRCEKFVEWQNEVQDLLSWYFNLEFQIQSFMLCLLIYVLSISFSSGVVWVLLAFSVVQIFVLCLMGERVTSRIDQLSFEIGKNWHLMTPPQRKALQMILHWTQNMKGFSGMFKEVNLETCKAIFEATYSLYTFLRSTNQN